MDYINQTHFFPSVAVIGMTSPNLSQTEDSIDVSVCVTLLQSQLEITLTAFIETQGVTATGTVLTCWNLNVIL